jgi:hypothetical protein
MIATVASNITNLKNKKPRMDYHFLAGLSTQDPHRPKVENAYSS